jgi:hypothetical protein
MKPQDCSTEDIAEAAAKAALWAVAVALQVSVSLFRSPSSFHLQLPPMERHVLQRRGKVQP